MVPAKVNDVGYIIAVHGLPWSIVTKCKVTLSSTHVQQHCMRSLFVALIQMRGILPALHLPTVRSASFTAHSTSGKHLMNHFPSGIMSQRPVTKPHLDTDSALAIRLRDRSAAAFGTSDVRQVLHMVAHVIANEMVCRPAKPDSFSIVEVIHPGRNAAIASCTSGHCLAPAVVAMKSDHRGTGAPPCSQRPDLTVCRYDQIQVGDAVEMLVTSFRRDFSTFKVQVVSAATMLLWEYIVPLSS